MVPLWVIRLCTAALFLPLVAAVAQPHQNNLKELVEASGAGIPWQEFQQMTGPQRTESAIRIGSALARNRNQDEWGAIRALQASDDREFLERGFLQERAWSDAATGIRELKEVPAGAERNVLARTFYEQWAAISPSQAAGALVELPAGPSRDSALDPVVVQWVAADAAAAARWASHLPATATGATKPLVIFGMAGAQNLMGAHYDRGDVMQLVAFEWAKRDRPAALKWAQSVKDPALREQLVRLAAGER